MTTWIYVDSNIRPTSPLSAELRCSNVGFQRSANDTINVGPTLGQHVLVFWVLCYGSICLSLQTMKICPLNCV